MEDIAPLGAKSYFDVQLPQKGIILVEEKFVN